MQAFMLPLDSLATFGELARAEHAIFERIMTPPPDAVQLPPYQLHDDVFITRSSLLSPPPLYMRGFGMPEFLWACFFDYMFAPLALKSLLLERTALAFRMRWAHIQVLIRTPEQVAWIRRHPPGPPRKMIVRIEELFLRWEEELRLHGTLADPATECAEFPLYDATGDTTPHPDSYSRPYTPTNSPSPFAAPFAVPAPTLPFNGHARGRSHGSPAPRHSSFTGPRVPYFGSPFMSPSARFRPLFGSFQRA
ncbi:hypothetical protein PENSPDRAFT_694099 [Peniophora sp. CONT]|nr:hypothetical protein PENSPDRAFT_694099 [Peniophora sp. CONT]